MSQRLGREPELETLCGVCGKLASNPVKCKWDDMLRTACRSCVESKCTEINNFTCPLTGIEECDVEEGLIDDAGIKGKIKAWEKEIREAYKAYEAGERATKARMRVAAEMERLVETDSDDDEFEDVKKTYEEVEGFGRDVFDDGEEEEEKRMKEEKKKKKEESERRKRAAEEAEKLRIRAAADANKSKEQTDLNPKPKAVAKVEAPRPPAIEPTAIFNPNINPITRLPRGYLIGPWGRNVAVVRGQNMQMQREMQVRGLHYSARRSFREGGRAHMVRR